MAKLEDVTPELKSRVGQIIVDYNLDPKISALVLSKPMKEVGTVSKASEIVKYTTKDDVVILINEEVFDLIGENEESEVQAALQQVVLENILTGIEYKDNTDSVSMVKPDFITYSGILKEFGAETMIRLFETIKSAKEQIKEDKPSGDLVFLFDDIKELFKKEMVTMKLEDLNINILSNDKEGERGKLKKVDELAKIKHNDKDDIELVINQRIFELLEPAQQIIAARVILSGIVYDRDLGSFSFKKPDFEMHSGVVSKFGAESCIAAHEAINKANLRYDEILKERKEEEKNAKNRAAAHA